MNKKKKELARRRNDEEHLQLAGIGVADGVQTEFGHLAPPVLHFRLVGRDDAVELVHLLVKVDLLGLDAVLLPDQREGPRNDFFPFFFISRNKQKPRGIKSSRQGTKK